MRELDCGTVKVVKPQIKQPKVAEKKKSDNLVTSERRKDTDQKDAVTSEDVDLSESTESVKTLVESPRIREDHLKSSIDDSIKTESDVQLSEDIRTDSNEPELSDNVIDSDPNLILTESSLNNITESHVSEVIKTEFNSLSDAVTDKPSGDLDGKDSELTVSDEFKAEINDGADDLGDREAVSDIISDLKKSSEIEEEIQVKMTDISPEPSEPTKSEINGNLDLESIKEEADNNHEETSFIIENLDLVSEISSKIISDNIDDIEKEYLKSEMSSITDSEEVKTESLLRSLGSVEEKDLFKVDVDVKVNNLETDRSEEISTSSIVKDDEPFDDEISVLDEPSNKNLINEVDDLPTSDVSIISSINSSENVHMMSAALMRAIEETKEKEEESLKEEIEPVIEEGLKTVNSIEEKYSSESIKTIPSEEEFKEEPLSLVEKGSPNENVSVKEIEEELSPLSDKSLKENHCDETFIINKDESGSEELMKDEDAEDLMLRMISDSFSDSERLWNLNLEEYHKIREETPFLTALQRENDISNTMDAVSQQLFRNLFESAMTDVFRVYAVKKESASIGEFCF